MTVRAVAKVVREDQVATLTWEGLVSTDTGTPAKISDYPDRTVQAVGTFGGGSITIKGSNDGTTWSTLHDNLGVTLVLTDSAPRLIAENTDYIRPEAAATTDVDVIIIGMK